MKPGKPPDVPCLFGGMIEDNPPKRIDRAHAAPPGTGPTGETCGSCCFLARVQHPNVYRKCSLMWEYWSGGPATDVRCKDKACSFWEEGPQEKVLWR